MNRAAPHGFTLIELLVVTAIMGILMAAVGSAMIVAVKASPSAASPEQLTRDSDLAVQEIARELSQATSIFSAAADSVSFSVPDRTGDAVPESITYRLNGESVMRTINSGTEIPIASGVTSFDLGYTAGTRALMSTSAPTEGAEQVLFACYQSSGDEFALESNALAVQSFRPYLPPEATSWRVTKVNLYCKRDGLVTGTTRIQVFASDSQNFPTGSALGQATVTELLMGSGFGWKTFSFGAMSIPTSSGAALVIANNSISVSLSLGSISLGLITSGSSARILKVPSTMADDGVGIYSSTGGGGWVSGYDDAFAVEVIGRITATTTSVSAVKTIDAADIVMAVRGAARASRASVIIGPRPAYSSTAPGPILELLDWLL